MAEGGRSNVYSREQYDYDYGIKEEGESDSECVCIFKNKISFICSLIQFLGSESNFIITIVVDWIPSHYCDYGIEAQWKVGLASGSAINHIFLEHPFEKWFSKR